MTHEESQTNLEAFAKAFAFCIVAVVLFLVGTGAINVNLLSAVRRRFSRLQRQIDKLAAEINEQSIALARISMVDEFAAYFKKKRVIDKNSDELRQLSKWNNTR